jgi:PKD repeat protein
MVPALLNLKPENMKTKYLTALAVILLALPSFSQTLTELAVPRFFGSKSSGSSNNTRTPFGVCLRIDGLLPNTVYDVKGGIGLATDPATTFGAGNIWDGAAFSSSRLTAAFTTDAAGSSGPFWLFFQPTGNSARFDAGQIHNIRIGYAVTGATIPGVPAYVGTRTLTALDIAVNQRTATGSDDGAFIRGSALPSASGLYVLFYDNTAGTGDPLFIYQVRQAVPVQTSGQSDLPATIGEIYLQGGNSAAGDYPAVIPTGSNNPAGVRRVEARNPDFSVFAYNTDDDGIWPGGGNTAGAVRREVVVLTNTDAPLVPDVPTPPVVLTDTLVTVVTYDSVVSGGKVTADGGDSVTWMGLCWSTDTLPSVTGQYTSVPGDTGSFTAAMTGLLPDTVYHFRAFATNSAGTAYGTDRTFMTPCEPYLPVSGFWADDTTIYTGDTVNFFDATIHCPDTWNWSFVGGIPMSSPVPNPTGIVFNFPGAFNICLTTSNINGTHTLCRHGYITVTEYVIPKIVITEIMYNPPESGTDSLEFIELYNNDTVTLNMQDFYFSEGITYTFPDLDLNPGGYVVLGKNDSAIWNTFGITAMKWTSGSLTNGGELIRLKDCFGNTVDSVQYDDNEPWDPLCNGGGYSLELCDPGSDNALAENWRRAIGFAAVNAEGDSIWAHPSEGCLFLPVAAFIAGDTLVMEGDSVQFTSVSTGSPLTFEWVFEGGTPGIYEGEFPPAVHYPGSGSWDVSLKVTNLAGEDILVRNDMISVGEYTGLASDQTIFSVFPNPAGGGQFRMTFRQSSHYRITLRSVTGQVISETCTQRTYDETVRCDLAPALYFISVVNLETGAMGVQKLVIR